MSKYYDCIVACMPVNASVVSFEMISSLCLIAVCSNTIALSQFLLFLLFLLLQLSFSNKKVVHATGQVKPAVLLSKPLSCQATCQHSNQMAFVACCKYANLLWVAFKDTSECA